MDQGVRKHGPCFVRGRCRVVQYLARRFSVERRIAPRAGQQEGQTSMTRPRAMLLPLFFISAAAVGFEIVLARYFSIASWSEYGYWVISITMVGFAVSGVVLSLFKDAFARRAETLLFAVPL